MAGHGARPLRGLESTGQSSVGTAKFGRMFRWLAPGIAPQGPDQEKAVRAMLTDLAGLMVTSEFVDNAGKGKFPGGTPDAPITISEADDENPKIAAGYTYLGQFIDHDITFDPASSLQRLNDPDALEDFRTPRLDLDCLYGRGPADQPYLYDKDSGRCKFVVGKINIGVNGMDRRDVQRSGDNTALIGDKRNDENKIVAQIQALFQKFHNKVHGKIAGNFGPGEEEACFHEAQRIVRWCYQWIVLHDFLPKICNPKIVTELMPATNGREPRLQFFHPHGGEAYIPVEFSVAAYRFGHSMVRPSYALNSVAISSATFEFVDVNGQTQQRQFGRIPIFVHKSKDTRDAMNGFGEPIPDAWGIDWTFFFGTPRTLPNGQKQIPQPSYRIDAFLVDPLGKLPEFATALPPFASLAFRNLQRGVSMGLPSGQSVARMMGVKPKDILTDAELWTQRNEGEKKKPEDWPQGKAFFDKPENKRWLAGAAPLWYYILKEAEIKHQGHHLGDVGSRIVAETLIGLAWNDHYSYLFQEPHWDPTQEELLNLPAQMDMLALTQWADKP